MSKKKDITALTLSVPNTDKCNDWIVYNNSVCMPLGILAEMFGKTFHHASESISTNNEIFDGYVIKIKKDDIVMLNRSYRFESRSTTITCLDIAGVLQWVSLLKYASYDDDRKNYIILMKRWLVESGKRALLNQIKPVDERGTIEWNRARDICKESNKILNHAIKENILPYHKSENARWLFINEAIMINKTVFGRHERGIRDTAVSTEELIKLNVAEISDATLCHQKILNMGDRKAVIESMLNSYLPEKIQEDKKKLRGGQRLLDEF